jgi:hypothetical protein
VDTLSDVTLARLVEHAEAQAYLDLFRAAPPDVGLRAYEFDAAAVLTAPAFDMPLFNRAIGLGLSGPVTEPAIQAIATIFRNAGVRNFAVQVSPAVLSNEIEEWLRGESLVPRDAWAKMFRSSEADPVIETDLRIERIGPEFAHAFADVARRGFGVPPSIEPWLEATVGRDGWHHYLAWDGLTPVAASALFVREVVGWLGIAATLPSHRRRGAQGAMMAQRIRDGRALGCEWFITETGEDRADRPNPSYHNMLRTGFALAYLRPNYMTASR